MAATQPSHARHKKTPFHYSNLMNYYDKRYEVQV